VQDHKIIQGIWKSDMGERWSHNYGNYQVEKHKSVT